MPKSEDSKLIRLQKYIADCGVTSRRKAEDLITAGKVSVNGETVWELGTKVDPSVDLVDVDGSTLSRESIQKIYIVMNKPRAYMTTLSDPEGRPTVMDFLKEFTERIYPVGRLDYLSEGLLILTNDGEVANLIMHPRYEIIKIYEVKVFGAVTPTILESLKQGANIDGHFVKPKSVRIIKQLEGKTWIEFRIGEGRNREIRRICEASGVTVDKLKRLAIGGLTVEGIAPGKFRTMSKRKLLEMVGIDIAGAPLKDAPKYQSMKKTIDLQKRGVQTTLPADDKSFIKFRREHYFATIKAIKEEKQKRADELKQEEFIRRTTPRSTKKTYKK